MAKILTGPRMAKSTVSVGAISTTETDEVDFELGADQGIELLGFKHILSDQDSTLGTAGPLHGQAQVSLHAETQSLEDPNLDADDTVRDSEIVDAAVAIIDQSDDSGAAQGGMTVDRPMTSSGWMWYPSDVRPIFVVNLTHRVETDGVMTSVNSTYLLLYRYVRLSAAELGNFLALRR